MDTFEAIKKRRSINHFDPDHRMKQEDVNKLISYAMLSPTVFNIQNVRYVVVKDPELRKKIRAVSWNQRQVTDGSLLIVLCADLKSWKKDPGRYWKNAPAAVKDFYVKAIQKYFDGNVQAQHDEAMRSCGLAAQTIMLAAKAMGYDTCPMDGFDAKAVGKLINLPKDHVISMFVVVGRGLKPPWPRPGQLSREEVVVENGFK